MKINSVVDCFIYESPEWKNSKSRKSVGSDALIDLTLKAFQNIKFSSYFVT